MPDPARTHSDNFLAWGSQSVTVFAEGTTSGGVNYIAESGSINRGSNRLLRNNEAGIPVAKVLLETIVEGSIVLQIASSSVVAPAIGSYFKLFPKGVDTTVSTNAKAFTVEKVSEAFDQNGETKFNVDFSEKFAA